jgi:GDPmannose 4,6-dehydratase
VAFATVGLNYQDHITINPKFLRPAEVDLLLGDPAKAKAKLGWEPTTTMQDMIAEMVEADLKRRAGK